MSGLRAARLLAAALLLAAPCTAAGPARADESASPGTVRDAQLELREALRDTAGHPGDAARLAALGVAALRLGRYADASAAFRAALASDPRRAEALAGLGRIALLAGRDAEAESLLAQAGDAEGAAADLYAVRLRRGEWHDAAAMCEAQDDAGHAPLLERLAAGGAWTLAAPRERTELVFTRDWPVPLVRVTLDGHRVVMAVDTGSDELLLDASAARLAGVTPTGGERLVPWDGSRVAAKSALVRTLALGAFTLANVPAAVTELHAYSLLVNPQENEIAGVIGAAVLRRFGATLDFRRQVLELVRPGVSDARVGARVPFERWGVDGIVVWGSVAGGRRMAMQIATGLPGAGLGAPAEVYDELGLKSGRVSNLVHGAGSFLQGEPWTQIGVPSVTLGTLAQGHMSGWSGVIDPPELWRHGVRLDALLGPEFFRGRRVTFDWDRREIVVAGD